MFDVSTVNGTQNVLMAACLARGTSVIENAALEPEVGEDAHDDRALQAGCVNGAFVDYPLAPDLPV